MHKWQNVNTNTGVNKSTHFIASYALDTGKSIEVYTLFLWRTARHVKRHLNYRQSIIRDLDVRTGYDVVLDVKVRFKEEVTNDRDVMLPELCAHNELRIKNTYFNQIVLSKRFSRIHKEIQYRIARQWKHQKTIRNAK